MKNLRNQYLQSPFPVAAEFRSGDRVAYKPHSGLTLHGTVERAASERGRYIVRFDDRTRAVDARDLSKLPD